MRVKKITDRYYNTYEAIMVCEFCSYEQRDAHGYEDDNYHSNVIPEMKCGMCQRSTKDELLKREKHE